MGRRTFHIHMPSDRLPPVLACPCDPAQAGITIMRGGRTPLWNFYFGCVQGGLGRTGEVGMDVVDLAIALRERNVVQPVVQQVVSS